jgi:hypothetical protein
MKIGLKIPSNITNTIGIGICLVSIGIYNILFFNKYLPLSEGWFSVYAHYIQSGAMPYRDFHFFLPPVYPYILSIFTDIFGDGFLGLRILGIVVILCITLLLFLLYSRLFPTYIACIVTIVSVIYWQSNIAFIGYNFISFLHLFTLLGAFLICKYFEYDDHTFKSGKGWMASAFLFCAGLFGVLAFLIKQSDGFYVVIFSFLAVAACAYAREGFPKAFRSVAIYSAGILVPLLALFIWLISNGLLSSFWNQVFVGASSSKGGLIAILFAWVPRIFTLDGISVLIVLLLTLIALRIYCFPQGFMLGSLGEKTYRTHFISTTKIVFIFSVIFILSMLCILLPFWNIDLSHKLEENHFLSFIFYRVLVTGFVMSLFLFCIYLLRILRKKEVFYPDTFIILTISLGLLWATSTSGGMGDMGMILALGLLLGYLAFIPSHFNVSKIASLALCVCIVLFSVSFKYIHPYSWWNLNQPDIRTVSTPINSKYFNGLIVSEQTGRIYSEVTSIVARYTKPGDHIYTFPNIPIFYLLTDRYPNTRNLVSWFDVLPDQFTEEDIHCLIESPPQVIIYLDVPEFVWKFHEIYFRDGKASGQRQIKVAIESLTSSGNYERDLKFDVMDGYTLSVWRLIEGVFDTHTKLLLHNDGTDGSTVFEDEMGKVLTAVGNAHIDTGEKMFGTGSGSFDGTGDYLTVPNSTDFDFGSEDFTIDGWFYFNTNSVGYQFMVDRRGNSDQTGWVFYLETSNQLSFLSASSVGWDNTVLYNTGFVPETGKWIHLAVVRNGDVFTMYQNGKAIRSGTYSGSIGAQSANLTIGAGHVIPGSGFNGYIDELRISKGIARWTTDFTPPAAPSTRESSKESFNETNLVPQRLIQIQMVSL